MFDALSNYTSTIEWNEEFAYITRVDFIPIYGNSYLCNTADNIQSYPVHRKHERVKPTIGVFFVYRMIYENIVWILNNSKIS